MNELIVFRGHRDSVDWATFDSTGKRLVTASSDKTARIWDVNTGNQLIVMEGHKGHIRSVAFNSTGNQIVTASEDGTARIWDAATGNENMVLPQQGNLVTMAAFNPAGDRVVSASGNAAQLWDVRSGQQVGTLYHPEGEVGCATFSPCGDRVFTASWNGTVRVWDSVPYRNRYPAIAAFRAAKATMNARINVHAHTIEQLEQVVVQLANDGSLDAIHRTAGLALVAERRESLIEEGNRRREENVQEATRLNRSAWLVVAKADSPPHAIAVALDEARRASGLAPDDANVTNTLGVGLYRNGQFDDAIMTLNKAEEQYSKAKERPEPTDWAFIAMAQFKLGKTNEAKSSLGRLRELMKESKHATNDEKMLFLHEAESLIEEKSGP